MNENAKVDEILSSSIFVNRQLSDLGEKLSLLTNQQFSKMDALSCANLITSVRAELNEMNKKIIENYISEDKKAEYLESNMGFIAQNYQDNKQFADIIEQRAYDHLSEESSPSL